MVLGNQDNVLFPVSSLNLYQYVSPIFVITINVTGISYNGPALVAVSVTIYLDLLSVSLSLTRLQLGAHKIQRGAMSGRG